VGLPLRICASCRLIKLCKINQKTIETGGFLCYSLAMKGDKKVAKKSKKSLSNKNRGEKLFEKLVYSNFFVENLKALRDKSGIEENGYDSMKKIYNWYSLKYNASEAIRNDFNAFVFLFLEKQKLPNNEWWQQKIVEHILSSGKFMFLPRTHPTAPFVALVGGNKAGQEPYTDLRIYERAVQKDIIDFIKDPRTWRFVNPGKRKGLGKIIQPERDPQTTKEIMKLWEKSKKELADELKMYDIPKESLLSIKMHNEKKGEIAGDNIKMRVWRKKKPKITRPRA